MLDIDLSQIDPAEMAEALSRLSPREATAYLEAIEAAAQYNVIEGARQDFINYVRFMWPSFIGGAHHRLMADAFERVLSGKLKRLIVNMPPRHTKSEFASIYLPSYFLGKSPDKKIIKATHTAELATGFGRKVKNLVAREDYQLVFPEVSLAADSKAAGRWSTNHGGEYFAIGVGGAVAGRGADLLVIDDPVDEQTALYGESDPNVYHKVYEWYTLLRQRLQPGGAIIIVMTRWSKIDLTGQLVKKMTQQDGEDWEVIELPAILPSGEPLWPQFWPLEELEKVRTSIPEYRWQAQYQQNPVSEEGALIKRDWWKRWDKKAPECSFVLQSWDTAMEATQRADYSACTTWGVFDHDDPDTGKRVQGIYLIDAIRGKWEFPELKEMALEHYKDHQPDSILIEKKNTGSALVYELRRMGIPVREHTPTAKAGVAKGQGKIYRVNLITDIFASGMVWAPHGRWVDEVIEECASFPFGDHDDYVDTVSQAMDRIRQGGMISTRLDTDPDEETVRKPRKPYY